jgi:hypothetical protein
MSTGDQDQYNVSVAAFFISGVCCVLYLFGEKERFAAPCCVCSKMGAFESFAAQSTQHTTHCLLILIPPFPNAIAATHSTQL